MMEANHMGYKCMFQESQQRYMGVQLWSYSAAVSADREQFCFNYAQMREVPKTVQ